MGLHARYYPISPTMLADLIVNWHAEGFFPEALKFREESSKREQEFYIGTGWHVLDFIINPPNAEMPELVYAVRGHEFPDPDGIMRPAPHLPSYDDEWWQLFTYVTTDEVRVIAQYLHLIDKSEFESRFSPEKMEGIYRAPLTTESKTEYWGVLSAFKDFYGKAANEGMAILISIG